MARSACAGRARFRRLGAADRAARLAHLARLGAEGRRARFRGSALAADPPEPALALGCWIDGRLRGLAELYPLPADGRWAELAASVEPEFQGQGLGRALLARLLILARNRGIRRLLAFCGETDGRPRLLLRRAGARLCTERGEARAELDLLPASPATLLLEALDAWEELTLRLLDSPCALAAGPQEASGAGA